MSSEAAHNLTSINKNIFYYFIYRQFHIIFLYVHLSCCRGLSVLSGLNIKVIKSHLDRNLYLPSSLERSVVYGGGAQVHLTYSVHLNVVVEGVYIKGGSVKGGSVEGGSVEGRSIEGFAEV